MKLRKLVTVTALIAALALGGYIGYVLKQERGPIISGPAITVSFLDTDLGGGTVIRMTDGKLVVLDPGPQRSADNLIDYLKNLGAQSIAIVISNCSAENTGALKQLVESFAVSRIYLGEKTDNSGAWRSAMETINSKKIPQSLLYAGNTIHFADNAILETLSPPKGMLAKADNSVDNNSLVTRMCFGDKRFLFTSDIRSAAEAYLYSSGADLRSDVLTIPRHGRWPLVSLELLMETRPQICELSIAKSNETPNRALLARIAAKNTGACLYRTDKYGTIDMITDGRSIRVDTERSGHD